MKETIDHLPEEKRKDLERAVSVIREMCDDIEMIILFGSHARGDWKDEEDLLPDRPSGAPSDYDILVLCRENATEDDSLLWSRISDRCNGYNYLMPFRIIVHNINFVKERLREVHFFYSDIVKEGCLLYNSGSKHLYASKELAPQDKERVAQDHFNRWFKKAKGFYKYFEFGFKEKDYILSSFQLHQAAESSYKALLLVFTNYCPYGHFLKNLDTSAREFLLEVSEIFPRETKEKREKFKNFDYAYIGARYDPKFNMPKEDLDYFSGRVAKLIELTEKKCKEKIKSYQFSSFNEQSE